MLRFLLILFFGLVFNANFSQAFMPSYLDGDEYFKCIRATNNYNNCADEQARERLNTVKKQYRTILTNPNILGWHKNISDNTATLRDMYESWTAFRNRLCSLSNKAAKYLEPLIDEKIGCNSYYITHHQDHLNSIILLLTKNVPQKRGQFDYLKIYDHDDEYEECMKGKDTSKCLDEELKRSSKGIKNLYKTLLEDDFVGKWNNGPDLKNGNYRDMYDSWIAYRNRMCSLSVWAYQVGYGKSGVGLNQCLQFFNREKLETLQNLLMSASSALDDEYDEDFDDDGGEAEGKTIKPLERRFDEKQNKEDALEPDEKAEPLIKKAEPKKQAPEKKVNVPSWAK